METTTAVRCDPFVYSDNYIVGASWANVGYRCCDWCYDSACNDIWDGKLDAEDWRKFYLLDSGESCCERCLDQIEGRLILVENCDEEN